MCNKIQSLTQATLFSRLPETNKPFCVKLTKEKCVCLICGTTFTFLIPLVSWNSLKWKSLAFVTPCLGLTGLLTSTYRTSKKKAGKKRKEKPQQSWMTLFEKTCFSALSTLLTSAGNHLSRERPLVSPNLPKDSCCSSRTLVPSRHKKSPLNVWLSHRNSLLNGISVMDSC